MFIDLILLLWIQSLDAKLLRNNFRKQLNDVVSHFTHVPPSLAPSVVINFGGLLKLFNSNI
jgi:hypothetical protein